MRGRVTQVYLLKNHPVKEQVTLIVLVYIYLLFAVKIAQPKVILLLKFQESADLVYQLLSFRALLKDMTLLTHELQLVIS